MSSSRNNHYNRLLKHYLVGNGMKWKSRDDVLRTPYRDRRIVQALRQNRVRLRPHEVQQELCSVIQKAEDMARLGDARAADDSYEFVLEVW